MVGLAGAAIVPGTIYNRKHEDHAIPVKKNQLIYRTLGNTGIKIPIVSIGAGTYDKAIYQNAYDAGIMHIDTSQYYYNGRHEELVGEVIKDWPRDSYVLATSILFGGGDPTETEFAKKLEEVALAEEFEKSLKRLGLEYVDIFYMAGINTRGAVLFEPFIEKMINLKKEGKVHHIGVATHQNEPEVIRAAVESKVYEVVLTAYNFKQEHRDEVKKAIAYATDAGIGIVAMKPLAGVYWDKERKQPINGKAANKWVLQDPNVTTVIPGVSSYDQLQSNLSIMEDLPLSKEEKSDLRMGNDHSSTGLYCRQCQKCVPQCPERLNIPDLMRSYMYAYGYKDLAKAKMVLDENMGTAISCNTCPECKVECPSGFNIREKIADISRLRNIPEEFII